MNYYQPREMKDEQGSSTGKWHYTCRNDGHIFPIGYCAQGCPGHDTKDGAYEHQRQYVLDTARYDGRFGNTQHKCMVCEAWTQNFAEADHVPYCLCDAHRNREELEKLVTVGDAFGTE